MCEWSEGVDVWRGWSEGVGGSMTLSDTSYRYESTHSKYVEKLPAQYQRSGPILLVVALW